MKNLLLPLALLLALVACAPGQSAPTMTAPSAAATGGLVSVAGRAPSLTASSCELAKAIPDHLVCSHVDDGMERPAECCQRCNLGTWELQNCPSLAIR